MNRLADCAAWTALAEHHRAVGAVHMRDLFRDDPGRFEWLSLRLGDMLVDWSSIAPPRRPCACSPTWRAIGAWRSDATSCTPVSE